jgi:hypothetical protein
VSLDDLRPHPRKRARDLVGIEQDARAQGAHRRTRRSREG